MAKHSPLKEKSLSFSIRIVNLYKHLTTERGEFVISKQLLRAGTNPGAMVREANNAESAMDFIHKLGIAQKELSETQYWLELLFHTAYLNEKEFESMHNDSEEMMRMIRSSILTKKKNLGIKVGSLAVLVTLFFTLISYHS
jgi:four helix bundle protein